VCMLIGIAVGRLHLRFFFQALGRDCVFLQYVDDVGIMFSVHLGTL